MDAPRRHRVRVVGLLAVGLVVAVGVPVLLGTRDLGDALVRAAVLVVVMVLLGVGLSRYARRRAADGVLEGGARADPGVHPEVDDRWHRVEIRPTAGAVDLRPLAGGRRSWRVGRLVLDVRGEPEVGRTIGLREGWRIAPGLVVVALATPGGTVELAVRRDAVDLLRERLRPAG
ncbi:hypothetical protein GC089_17520 [Cellulomonas sp. JZ18]|uniref:hypothetical protein n=1 Tax=Cellulomonas sp. JZ18 TaxID=2654191 RepID=UPI0012D44936|nr:hypothetical protein [Cellulomonas sp. JZ18]QGQ20657.1 hypothetical protein GC089_17520 [Cellulomonas sp. JZ18]